MSDELYDGWSINAEKAVYDAIPAPEGAAYPHLRFNTNDDNVFIFTHQGGNRYYIQNKSTGKYFLFKYFFCH